jgi:hypothetical protein
MKTVKMQFHWIPRIICILAILFISMFAADAFSHEFTIWQQLGAFLVHLVPSFVLLGILLIAWKWELIGGILFTLIGVGLSPFVYMLNHNRNHFSVCESLGIITIITVPFIVVGILFIISSRRKKQ